MKKKRLGILTYHHVINDGALLQAYCLSQRLKKHFPDYAVEIIDYRPLSIEIRDFLIAFHPFQDFRALFEKARRYRNLRCFMKNRLPLSQKRKVTDHYSSGIHFLKNNYDAVVVGSDEVWKIEKGHFVRTFPNPYWLSKDLSCKKIAYAASAHKLAAQDLKPEQTAWIKDQIRHFDLIGVRDRHTRQFIEGLGLPHSEPLWKLPDPAFGSEIPEQPVREKAKRLGVDFTKPLLAITFNEKRIKKDFFSYFKKQGYQMIALTAFNPYADVQLAGKLNPFEWASLFQHLKLCLTHLYHGTILSLKNGVPVLGFDYSNDLRYESKMRDLFGDFDLLDFHIPAQPENFETGFLIQKIQNALAQHHPAAITKKIAAMNQETESFLDRMRQHLP